MKRAALVGSEYRIGIGRKSDMEERTGGEKMEASTGIEPVYTDLQSRKNASENNDLRVQNTP